MKKFLFFMVAMLMTATAAISFSACSSDDDGDMDFIHFSLAAKQFSYSGKDVAAFDAYRADVIGAYRSALGMGKDDALVYTSGDYKAKCKELKSKFDGVKIPEAPELGGTFTLVVVLYGTHVTGSSEDIQPEEVAINTITNK